MGEAALSIGKSLCWQPVGFLSVMLKGGGEVIQGTLWGGGGSQVLRGGVGMGSQQMWLGSGDGIPISVLNIEHQLWWRR